MNIIELKGNWNALKSKLKDRYSNLSEDDFAFFVGKESELWDHLQKKIGKTKDQIFEEIQGFRKSNKHKTITTHTMNKSGINKTLWLSGLVTGALVGAYLYKNKDDFEPQREKLNSLLGDFQSLLGDLKNRVLEAKSEGIEATKTALQSAKEKVDKVK